MGSTNPVPTSPRVTKTIHDRFHLLNCLFSDELAEIRDSSDDVDWAALGIMQWSSSVLLNCKL